MEIRTKSKSKLEKMFLRRFGLMRAKQLRKWGEIERERAVGGKKWARGRDSE